MGSPYLRTTTRGRWDAQLYIVVSADASTNQSPQHVGTTFTVRNGQDFIEQVFGAKFEYRYGNLQEAFLAGSVSWETVIADTFGKDAQRLLKQLQKTDGIKPEADEHILRDFPFRVLYQASIMFFIVRLGGVTDYQAVSDYMATVVDKLPELERFNPIDLREGPMTISKINEMFSAASDPLCDICECYRCKNHFGSESRPTMCLAIMAHTIISLTHLMERCHLHANLRPKRFGLHSLYLEMEHRLVRLQGGLLGFRELRRLPTDVLITDPSRPGGVRSCKFLNRVAMPGERSDRHLGTCAPPYTTSGRHVYGVETSAYSQSTLREGTTGREA